MTDLAVSLLATRDLGGRARAVASAISEAMPDTGCALYRYSLENQRLYAIASSEVSVVAGGVPAHLAEKFPDLAGFTAAVSLSGAQLRRGHSAHLSVSRAVSSLAYIPVHAPAGVSPSQRGSLLAVIELVAFSKEITLADFDSLEPLAPLVASALQSADQLENERQESLNSIHRMSQLYDLEKSLNATLELDEVTAIAPEKVRMMLDCQAVHLWLFDSDVLRLTASSGDDATVKLQMTQEPGEGYVADMAEVGEVLLIDDPHDTRLDPRNSWLGRSPATPPIRTALLVPLMQEDAEVGVLEAINKSGNRPFDDDDVFFLTSMAETVSSALKNANLMHAERKLAILETLVQVSSEITSTLRLDRLMQIIVNSPQTVLPYDRCAVALDNRGTLQLKAVSGRQSLPIGDVQVDQLNVLVRWLSHQPGILHLKWHEENEEVRLPRVVLEHFEVTGNRALYSIPLDDDQGRLGLLLYEAADPDFLDLPQIEMIKILAGQATVAIRNALLYREVPLISLLEPLAKRKNAIFRSEQSRRNAYSVLAAITVFFLLFFPLPMRVKGRAIVAPLHTVNVDAPLEGNVSAVYVREGQQVQAGQLLGALNDWEWRADVSSAEARYQAAQLTMEEDLARGSARAGADRAQADLLRAQLDQARSHLEDAQMRSPIAGVITTPHIQNAVGQHLIAGANFTQVLDLSSAYVDIAVEQSDVRYVATGQHASIKLDSFPQSLWHGSIEVVAPQAQVVDGDRVFYARVPLGNNQNLLRAGMNGYAKIFVGYRPAGYVLLRKPFFWAWHTLWNWIGW